jgi:hypothetical protein
VLGEAVTVGAVPVHGGHRERLTGSREPERAGVVNPVRGRPDHDLVCGRHDVVDLVGDAESFGDVGLTMSGIGDNYQLHTLLASRLIGDPARGLLPGEPPPPSWVAAATTAPPRRPLGDPILSRFRLFDGTGARIYPEGVPADIALTGGVRVIVLHPAREPFGWMTGRTYAQMIPELTLNEILSPAQARTWHAQITPARETGLFGPGGPTREQA